MITIDEQPITATVRDALAVEGTLAPTVAVAAVQPIANGPGLFGSGVTIAPRTVRIVMDAWPDSLPDRITAMDAIHRRVSGLRLLRMDDAPTRELWMTCTGVSVELYHYSIPRCTVEVTFTAADPTRYERDPIPLALTTSRTTCAIGTQSVAPRLWLYGASPSVVDPVVILRNARGDEVSRLTLSGTLTTNDALDIQCAAHRVDLYQAGVLATGTSAGDAWVETDSEFPVFDPEDAIDGDGITLELSATSGTPTGMVLYRKGY